MTAGNGKPCKRCGTSKWYKGGGCVQCVKSCALKYQRENSEKLRETTRKWQRNNPDKHCLKQKRRYARKHGNGGSFTTMEWKTLCDQYDNKCAFPGCDRADIEADHVIPISKGGHSNIDNIQPLCRHHNASKREKIIDYRTKPGIKRWIQKKLFKSLD